MMFWKYTISVLVIFGLAVTVSAEDGNGGYAAPFLEIPIGARPAGMGGAFISIADDGAGMFFNPAGVCEIRNTLFSSSYRLMDLDRTLTHASFVIPTANKSALSFSWLYAGSGDVEARNSDGDKLGYEFGMDNHKFSFAFSKRFEDFLAAGISGSYLHSSFSEMTSFSVSLDLGLILYFDQFKTREQREAASIRDLQAGIVVRNIGANYRWNNENFLGARGIEALPYEVEDKVPLEFGAGGSARFFNRKLLTAVDLVANTESDFALHGGLEYFLSPQFALRTGYSDKSFTAGTGYVFKLSGFVAAIDYAFSSEKVDEGSEHIFSFDVLF
ncbi:MAG: PorV/PorQ family protein [Candidatus Zixiibacteriota bacterium]